MIGIAIGIVGTTLAGVVIRKVVKSNGGIKNIGARVKLRLNYAILRVGASQEEKRKLALRENLSIRSLRGRDE